MPRTKQHHVRDGQTWWKYSTIPSRDGKRPRDDRGGEGYSGAPGWRRHHDTTTGRAYYFHWEECKSQWEPPEGWVEESAVPSLPWPFVHRGKNTRQDEAYYENLVTRECRYEPPPWVRGARPGPGPDAERGE